MALGERALCTSSAEDRSGGGRAVVETSPKVLVQGEMTDGTSELLALGSGHNHWNSWSMVKCTGLVMKAAGLHRFQSNCIQA